MTRIIELNQIGVVADNDLLPIFSIKADATRAATVAQLAASVAGTATAIATTAATSAAVASATPAVLTALSGPDGAGKVGHAQPGTGATIRTLAARMGDLLTLADYTTPDAAIVAAAGKRLFVGPAESVTLNVPTQYATIQAALDAIAGWEIFGTLTIKCVDGTYPQSATILVNHPYWKNIRIVGNETTPANCVLLATGPGFDGIVAANGMGIGYLNGFKIVKSAKALAADNTTAILANNGARVICGPNIEVDKWYYGIAARNGSFIFARYAKVNDAGDVGIWSFVGSTVDCQYAVSSNAGDAANGWGFGFQAEYGAAMNCSGASASGCLVGGIAALSGSNVRALNATASNNTGSGFFARDGGTIEAHGATASNNARYGVESIADGHTYFSSITTAGNTLGNHTNKAYFDNGSLGARLVADSGPMRIDNSSTSPIYFNTSQGLQFEVFSGAGDSHWGVTQASGYSRLQVLSSLDNADGEIAPKGTGVLKLKGVREYADDAAAAAGGVPVTGLYKTGSILKIRAA